MAESFGVDPDRYDRARPRYPDALITRIVAESTHTESTHTEDAHTESTHTENARPEAHGAPIADILDVGCGTGIEARQLQAAGCRVLGIDPDERMAEFARRTGVDVEVATFENWDARGRSFDAVVAGQSWHWVDPVVGATKAADVLRPGGLLAAFAHTFDPPEAIARAQREAFRRVAPDSPLNRAASTGAETQPRTAQGMYQKMIDVFADGIREATHAHGAALSEPEQWRFEWDQTYMRDQWLDLLPTTGGLTRLPPDALREIVTAVSAAIDSADGSFTMHYVTLAATAHRSAHP